MPTLRESQAAYEEVKRMYFVAKLAFLQAIKEQQDSNYVTSVRESTNASARKAIDEFSDALIHFRANHLFFASRTDPSDARLLFSDSLNLASPEAQDLAQNLAQTPGELDESLTIPTLKSLSEQLKVGLNLWNASVNRINTGILATSFEARSHRTPTTPPPKTDRTAKLKRPYPILTANNAKAEAFIKSIKENTLPLAQMISDLSTFIELSAFEILPEEEENLSSTSTTSTASATATSTDPAGQLSRSSSATSDELSSDHDEGAASGTSSDDEVAIATPALRRERMGATAQEDIEAWRKENLNIPLPPSNSLTPTSLFTKDIKGWEDSSVSPLSAPPTPTNSSAARTAVPEPQSLWQRLSFWKKPSTPSAPPVQTTNPGPTPTDSPTLPKKG